MNKTELITIQDNLIGVNYSLAIVESATELSNLLKSVLKKNKIDYKQYNSHTTNSFDKDNTDKNPPKEIYEYQNFFVLERTNGDVVLLDGFRRLLWYNAPSTPILVRFYKEVDLTSQQILTLLVNLNHFKFFSDQNYHERGFSLLLKTVFDIDITKMKRSFDAYLSSTETKNSYSSYGALQKQAKNEEIKKRIVNEFFISDLRFLQAIQDANFLADQYMGALVFEMRSKSNKEFDSDKFISLIKENKVLVELMGKYEKTGTDHSAKSQEVVNKIIEMYRNIFTLMEGGVVEQSFAEKQTECKELVAKLKKDKTLVKLTGHSKIHEIERAMDKMIAKGEKLEFVCVVHPNEEQTRYNNGKEKEYKLPHGLVEGVKFLEYTDKHLGMGAKEINIGLDLAGAKCRIWHNYGGYFGYGKKYTTLNMPYGSQNCDVDLFIRMEVEKKPKSTEPRKLKKFKYTPQGYGEKRDICVLAWTQKEARELFEAVNIHMSEGDMRNFVYQSWGNDSEAILKEYDQTQPCVYAIYQDKTIAPVKLK